MPLGSHIKQYYLEGKEAYGSGDIQIIQNPYTEGSAAYANWEAGWTDAWYEATVKGKS